MGRKPAVNALLAGLLATSLAGCTIGKPTQQPKETALPRLGESGEVIQPKRCVLHVATLKRPLRDEAINEKVWSVADEQSIAPETHRALQSNGLRIGVISGDLPAEVNAVLNAPPPHKAESVEFDMPDGERTEIRLNDAVPQVSLLLNQEGRAVGKEYKEASGGFRMTAYHDGASGVKLRLVPELHHGPVQRAFGALAGADAFAPQEFMQKDGQHAEVLRELGVSLVLQPGQAAVLSCRPESTRSLGSFLFTENETNGERQIQKVLIIWATRSTFGLPGNGGSPPAGLEPVEPPAENKP